MQLRPDAATGVAAFPPRVRTRQPGQDGPAGLPPAAPLGDLLVERRQLQSHDVARVLAHQRDRGLRFGEAAVALGLVRPQDVLAALSHQYRYPWVPGTAIDVHPDLVTLCHPLGRRAEGYRSLRAQLSLRQAAGPLRMPLAVISPQPGDGRSTTVANLAVAMAQLGLRTLVVDADLRQPRQHQLFALDAGPGLSALLSGRVGDAPLQSVAGLPGLSVLPAGALPPNPQELIEGPLFAEWLSQLARDHDRVIVDTPAANRGADAALVADRCGQALVVARQHRTRLAALGDLQQQLVPSGTSIVGVLMHGH